MARERDGYSRPASRVRRRRAMIRDISNIVMMKKEGERYAKEEEKTHRGAIRKSTRKEERRLLERIMI